MKKIQVGFLLSYDYIKLKNSIPPVYKEADGIFIAIDKDMRTWSGATFEVDPAFYDWLKEIDVDNKISSSVKFMKKHSYQLKVYSAESAIPEQIFNGTLPTTIIIGPKGTIVYKQTGMADYDNVEMLNFLEALSR